ncbi:lysylphosphatidylglycerol synthase domain-containing protein [Ornithinimicrobium pekingense]|uniref:Membrane protein n=1 Tax=Ornithinimicrobium pekingense TaxID=384677 RepID=A0ABQ2FC88_9MICO|nr:lysylphosphatidylglycerol synthase domain-containing protein [Ornithinimicrobium pekingense]GGK82781.1 membrane protein [Ornithinimicrobium pekingense]
MTDPGARHQPVAGESAAGAGRRSWARSALSRLPKLLAAPWVRRGFVILAVGAAVVALVLQWEPVVRALHRASWPLVLVALVLSFVGVLLAAMSWRSVSAGFGAPLGVRDAGVVYLVGQVGKYIPGGVWNLAASAELGHDRGVARRRTVGSLLVGALLSAVVGGALALLTMPGVEGTPLEGRGWLVVLAPLSLVLVLPVVLDRVLATMLRVTRQEPVVERIDLRTTAVACAWSALSWVAFGALVLALAVAVGAEPGMTSLRLAVGGYAAAWIVGSVLFFLPAGVGAREAVLGLALSPVLDPGGVLVVVLLSRVLVTAGDLAGAGVALAVAKRQSHDPRAV